MSSRLSSIIWLISSIVYGFNSGSCFAFLDNRSLIVESRLRLSSFQIFSTIDVLKSMKGTLGSNFNDVAIIALMF